MNVRITLLVVLVALCACKSQSKVDGTVTLNGAPFAVTDCSVGHSTVSFGGGTTTTELVTLIDGAGNRIQISKSDHAVRVSYMTAGGGSFADVGSGCGSLTFTTPPAGNPSAAAGSLDVNCGGSGYAVVAKARFERCGSYGL